jgi:cupin domain
MSIQVISPDEPNGTYHWETEQEDFLVLSGEALLVVEGQERPLKQWDFVHCPPETQHVFVGAGDGPCVLLAASSRQFQKDGPSVASPPQVKRAPGRARRPLMPGPTSGPWGFYTVDETARRYNAGPPENTQDGDVAYGRFPPSHPARYRDGLLPG